MDVYKIDQCLSANIGNVPQPQDDIKTEVTFEPGGSEFNLSFFDTEDTQGFSDPGSVGSTSVASPPPEHTHVIQSPTTTFVIKQGKDENGF